MAMPVFVQDERMAQCKEAEFYRIGSRDWEFRAPSIRCLGSLSGPLRFGLDDHDIDRFAELRVKSISKTLLEEKDFLGQRQRRSVGGHWYQQSYKPILA